MNIEKPTHAEELRDVIDRIKPLVTLTDSEKDEIVSQAMHSDEWANSDVFTKSQILSKSKHQFIDGKAK